MALTVAIIEARKDTTDEKRKKLIDFFYGLSKKSFYGDVIVHFESGVPVRIEKIRENIKL